MKCPNCNSILRQESTSCAEIYGRCHQWCWLYCAACSFETEAIESIDGFPSPWHALEEKVEKISS